MAEKKNKRYVVVPRTNEGYKEIYAVAGTVKVPFGQPVHLTEEQLAGLNNQKEAVKATGQITPYDLARDKGISIDKAVEMIGKMGNTVKPGELSWLPRYSVHEA